MQKKKIVVIGGGIVGLSAAYYLVKSGHKVTVIDKNNFDQGASWVNAGYLTPSHIIPLASPEMLQSGLKYMLSSKSPVYIKPRLNKALLGWMWQFYKSSTHRKVSAAVPIIKELNLKSRDCFFAMQKELNDPKILLENKGLFMLFLTKKNLEAELYTVEMARKQGLMVKELSPTELREVDPSISKNVIGGVHYLDDGHSDPNQFMKSLITYLKTQGVVFENKREIIKFDHNNAFITAAIGDEKIFEAEEFVLAAGVWSSSIAKHLKLKIPMEAGKGYSINLTNPPPVNMPALLMERKIAITPMNDRLRLAGTMELSGINSHVMNSRVNQIIEGTKQYYEGIEQALSTLDKVKTGLRPMSPDGMPYIGRVKHFKNLTIATGHAMMGWSLGPITGKMVEEIINHKTPSVVSNLLSPDRFS